MKNHTILPKPKWQSFCKCQRERRTKETNKYCNSFPFCSQTNWYLFILFIFLKIVTKIRLTYISSECVRVPIEINTPTNIYIFPSPSLSLSVTHTLTCTWARRLTASHAISAAMATRPRARERANEERESAGVQCQCHGRRARESAVISIAKVRGRESALQKELHIMLDNFRTKELLKLCQRSKKNTPATILHQFMAGKLHL